MKKKYFKFLLLLIGFIIFAVNGCRKPEDDPNGGGIQAEYGVQQSTYQKMPIIDQDLSVLHDSTPNE
ncbi:MAG: hypothetical protein RBS19_10845 [Bacteroidales bacterium]|nr:hypothetical protein [Bacteroidales bacterium]